MLSIIIPVYNVEKFLERCLESLVKQTYENKEIILVDDGSKDNSAEICKKFAEKYDYIKFFEKDNGGAVSAYVFGLKQCSGEYVAFVDSDDWVEPDMYSSMMSCFDKDKDINLVFCGYDKVFGEEHSPMNLGITEGIYDRSDIGLFFHKPNHYFVSFSRCNKIFIKDDVLKILPYLDESIRYAEDNLFCLLFMMKRFKKAYCKNEVYYHYYFNDKSVSTSISDSKLNDLEKVHKKLLEADNTKEFEREINSVYVEFALRMIRTLLATDIAKEEKYRLMKKILNNNYFEEARKNCIWECFTFRQHLKKFLAVHKMVRIYYYMDKIAKGK